MGTKPLQSDRGIALTLAATCAFFALWSASCGGGGGATVQVSTVLANITPNPITFPYPEPVGSPTTLSATLVNGGNSTLTISNIQVTGTNANDFPVATNPTPNCGGSIQPSASCMVSVTFTPSAAGIRTATVVITDNAAGSPQQVIITGTGAAPAAGLLPLTLPFGGQLVGTTTAAQMVTLSNTGNANLTFNANGITTSGPFAIPTAGTTCSAASPVPMTTGTCTVAVTFTPTATGAVSGMLTFNDNAGTQTVSLSGTGTAPTASFTQQPQAFSGVVGITTEPPQVLTLTNGGNAPLSLYSIIITSPPFNIDQGTTTCSISIAVPAGGNCAIGLTFTATSTNQASGTLTITDNVPAPNGTLTVPLSGTGQGNNPIASPSVSTLAFGNQIVNTSNTLPLTLYNTGNLNLTISANPIISGAGFSIQSTGTTCVNGSSIPGPSGSCVVMVTFSPTATAPASGTLVFSDNATPSSQTVQLTGTGTSGILNLSATSLIFPPQTLQTSSMQMVTLTNGTGSLVTFTGATPIQVVGAQGTNFVVTTNPANFCAGSLAPLAQCIISITFTPTLAGSQSATVSIADSAPGSPQTISLLGTGNGPVASLGSTGLTFSNVPLETTSAAQPVILTNQGTATLTINSSQGVSLTGTNAADFNLSGSSCTSGTTLAAYGGQCTVLVSFTPTIPGNQATETAMVNIADNAPNSPNPQTITLSGTGYGPVVTYAPTSLSFGNVPVQPSTGSGSSQTLTVKNNGNATLTITGPSFSGSGYYSIPSSGNTCGSSLLSLGSCTISVAFIPTAPGNGLAGSFSLTDTALSQFNPSVSLTGNGIGPSATIPTAPLTFNSQNVGTTSASQPVTLSNSSGTAALTISSPNGIMFTGTNANDFKETDNCGASVPAGGTCTINVTFTPVAGGNNLTAQLAVTDNSLNAAGSQQTLAVSGTGIAPVASILPNDTSSTSPYNFNGVDQGTTSAAQTFTVTNSGTAPLTFTNAPTLGGANPNNFNITSNSCSGPLSVTTPPSSCTFNVTFSPTTAGTTSYTATVTITDNAPGSPQTVFLEGTGISGIGIVPSPLSFGNQNIATSSSPKTITISNNGTSNFTISTITSTDSTDFSESGCTGAVLTAGTGQCMINVTFSPQSPGSLSTTLTINYNLSSSPQMVTVTGTGIGPYATLSSANLTFPSPGTNLGSTSAAQSVAVSNSSNGTPGTANLNITSVSVMGGADPGDFSVNTTDTNACAAGVSVTPGNSCNVWVTFSPQAIGTRSATVSIGDNGPLPPQTFTVTGTGLAPEAGIASSLTFPNSVSLNQSTSSPLTLTNSGNAALAIGNITFGGNNPGSFSQTNTCGSSLAPPTPPASSNPCTITVTFSPTTIGTLTATMNIADNSNYTSGGATQTVSLTGTGTGPVASLTGPVPAFGTITENTSVVGTFTLSNTASGSDAASLNITNISLAGPADGDFTLLSTGAAPLCATGGSVAPGQSCFIYVQFKPTVAATETATLTVSDNAFGSTTTSTFSGAGTTSSVSLQPSSYNFGNENVGSTTPSEPFALSVTGGTLTIYSITIGGTNAGDFTLVNGTGGTYPQCNYSGQMVSGGSGCEIYVTFTPSTSGGRSASVIINDNATAGSPQTIALNGTGTSGSAGVSPLSLSWGNQNLGVTTTADTATLTNSPTALGSFTYSNIMIGGTNSSSFNLPGGTGACTTGQGTNGTLAIGASCTIYVTFDPLVAGNLSANVSIGGISQSVSLSGTGGGPQIQFTNSSGTVISGLNFGALSCPANPTTGSICPTFMTIAGQEQTLPTGYTLAGQPLFTASAPQVVTVTNVGTQNLSITNIAASSSSTSGDFIINDTCTSTTVLQPNQTCTVTVTYEPTTVPNTAGTSTVTLTFTDNNLGQTGSTQPLTFNGTISHDILIGWNASTTYGVTYDVYWGSTASGAQTSTTPIYCIVTTKSTASNPSCADPNPNDLTSPLPWYTVTSVAGSVQSPVPAAVQTTQGP